MITLTSPEIAELRRLRHLGVQRVLKSLEAQGVLRQHAGQGMRAIFEPSMIAPKDGAAFLAAIARVRRVLGIRDGGAWDYLKRSIKAVRKSAARRGLPVDLSLDDLRKLFERSAGRCEVTGVPFSLETFGTARSPFAPSIDRIDRARGYVFDNVRLTCQIANLAMNVWGDAVLARFITEAQGVANFQENFQEMA